MTKFLSMSSADAQVAIAAAMTHEELQSNTVELAQRLGWVEYHPWDSRHSRSGYPDLTLFHPGQTRILWVELKIEGDKRTPAQLAFGELITLCGGEYHLWYPREWLSGEIERVLKGAEQ